MPVDDVNNYPEAHGTPYKPAGDWNTWMGHTPTGKVAIGNSHHRLGVIPGYREEPLQEPYIIWDSRTIAAGDTVLQNGGTAGDVFDLKLGGGFDEGEPDGQAFPYSFIHAYKTMNWDNAFGTTPDPPGGFPSDVSQMGGGTCDGAYTLMVAISPLMLTREALEAQMAATGADDYDGYRYIEVDWLSNHDLADGGGAPIDQNFLGDNDDPPFDTGLFHEWYDFANYCQWLQQSPTANMGLETLWTGKLLTFVADPWAGEYSVYIDDELVQFYDTWGDYEPPEDVNGAQYSFVDWEVDCLQQDNGATDVEHFHETFLYFYGHESGAGGTTYIDNTAWNSIVGCAFFRGAPNKNDLQYWKEYFLPAGQGYQPAGLGHTVSRTGLAHTDSHFEEWVVPSNPSNPEAGQYPIDKLVFGILPARGGQTLTALNLIYAEFDVDPGDVIRIELGGAGAEDRTTGLGGWPDGGNGGLGSGSGLYGAGGGGSTRIYRNGVLYVVAPGSGGGAASTTGGGAPNVTDSAGMRISAPDFEGLNALSPPPGSVGLQLVKGQGATTSAPGAGGTGGGSAGVGSVGGTGTTSAASASHTGGGGGGGGYFGGGGGGAGGTGPSTTGGGAGSWFKHANVTFYDANPSPGVVGSLTPAANAEVVIYYW